MKKKFFFIMLLSLFAIITIPQSAKAVDISVGATSWFNWWQPPWENWFQTIPYTGYRVPSASLNRIKKPFESGPSLMIGPVFAIKFHEKWSMTSAFLVGKYGFNSSDTFLNYTDNNIDFRRMRRDVTKLDGDFNFSYNIRDYVKLFIGFKVHNYNYEEKIRLLDTDSGSYQLKEVKANDKVTILGTGFGLGFTIHLFKGLYMLNNLSVLIMGGSEQYKIEYATSVDQNFYYHLPRGKFTGYGGSGSLSLAYYITSYNITLSLGSRYQFLYYKQKNKDRGGNPVGGKYDQFFGANCSVIYSFNVGGGKKEEAGSKEGIE